MTPSVNIIKLCFDLSILNVNTTQILDIFSSYLKSKMNDNCSVITLKTVKSAILPALLNLIYKGTAVISENEMNAFIETAKKWIMNFMLLLVWARSLCLFLHRVWAIT